MPIGERYDGNSMTLQLNSRPDAYGWLYGHFTASNGDRVRVDIMPPLDHWAGDMQLDGYKPHIIDWVVYADGDEVARVTALDGIEAALSDVPKLNHGNRIYELIEDSGVLDNATVSATLPGKEPSA
jgi:hypothetical protein